MLGLLKPVMEREEEEGKGSNRSMPVKELQCHKKMRGKGNRTGQKKTYQLMMMISDPTFVSFRHGRNKSEQFGVSRDWRFHISSIRLPYTTFFLIF